MRASSACASSASMAYRISVSSGTCSSVFSCVACKVRVAERPQDCDVKRLATQAWHDVVHVVGRVITSGKAVLARARPYLQIDARNEVAHGLALGVLHGTLRLELEHLREPGLHTVAAWMHGAIGLQPVLLEVAASRSSLCAPTGSRTGTSSRPVARQGSCTRGWPGAAGCPLRPRRRGTSRWPRCIRCAAPRPAGRCCRSRRGRSRYRCPIRARQRSSTAALCLQRWSSGSVCCSASVLGSRLLRLVPKRAPQRRAESTPKPATSAL